MIEQPGVLGLPLAISVVLPPGAVLRRGRTSFTVPPGPAGTTFEEQFEFEVASLPREDLILTVDAQGTAAGVHAEIPYRFGRREPASPVLLLAPKTLDAFGLLLGPAVQITR